MIDIHCHPLPLTDDGPRTWEDCFAMCEKAIEGGITHIVATPHCNLHYSFNRTAAQEKITLLRQRFPVLKFSLGCEFTISTNNLAAAAINPANFIIDDTNYILIEVNEALLPRQNEEGIQELMSRGLVPVIAHPERNRLFYRHHDLLIEWISIGCISAITGNSLTGFWGSEVRSQAEQLLKKNLVHCIVSDGHDPVRRPLSLTEGVAAASRIVGTERAREMVFDNPERIVSGQPL